MRATKKQWNKTKRNYTDCELGVTIDQFDRQKQEVFVSLGSGISNKMKKVKRQKVTEEHFLVVSPDVLPLRHDFCHPVPRK